jgi:hypothetical protein
MAQKSEGRKRETESTRERRVGSKQWAESGKRKAPGRKKQRKRLVKASRE